MPTAPARCRSSGRRSGPTSSVRPRASPIGRRSSPGTRTCGSRYAEFDAEVDRVARALIAAGLEAGDRVGIWSPNRVEWALVQYATAKVGDRAREHQPGVPHARAAVRAASSRGAGCWSPRRRSRPATTSAMVDEVRDELPGLERVVFLETAVVGRAARRRRRGRGRRAPRALGRASIRATRSTSSTRRARPASRRARRSRTTTSSTTASSSARAAASANEDRICVPVPYYHCFGMVMGNLAATSHGACVVLPADGVRARRRARRGSGRALHRALRRADDVHRRARPPGLRLLRPVLAAHRDHGRLAVPGRGDAQGRRPHAHGRGDHLLRHDRDVARSRRRPAPTTTSSTAPRPSGACTRTWRSASPTPIPAARCRAARPASSRPAATASCSATGTTPSAPPRRSTRPAGCTPATSR